jgi:chromosomal replication initiator protein
MDALFNKKLTNILNAVCIIEEVRPSDIKGRNRTRALVDVRKLFVYFAKAIHPNISYVQIGKFLDRDHSTMIHYINYMNDTMDSYPNEETIIMEKFERVRLLSGNVLKFEIGVNA